MNRFLIRLLNPFALLLIALLWMAIQTSLFQTWPMSYFQPDGILILVIWCALQRTFTEGGILTLLMADFAELHSASPQGLYLATYLLAFLLVRMAALYFVLFRFTSIVLLTMGTFVVVKLFQLGLLNILDAHPQYWKRAIVVFFTATVGTTLLSMKAFRLLEELDRKTYRRSEREKDLGEHDSQIEISFGKGT